MNTAFPLPEPIGTDYEYILASRHDRIVMVAGQIAKTAHNQLHAVGRCGEDVDLPTAQKSAEIAAAQALAWLTRQQAPGERIERIMRMTAYVAVGDSGAEVDISAIADAASRVFISALGERGRHPRSVIGVSRLPRNAPVLLEVTGAIGSSSSE
ncbi:RidA family protein [Paracoccus jeotgali]|uniref:Uncharacterized protein n=1 Tax=Paracoccus jeotgali TaxID=2065379 RepID=A0A2K9MJM5_9RHOB|nr:RidA family protein [Paracoccus jeotgali]AUM75830.1 hypothetical protein CYR75_15540 [Paracoccus jeotgali]